jgi:ankyrin repeat protein
MKVNVICSLQYFDNERPIKNSSALHVAAAKGSVPILKKLLGARAVLHLKNDLDLTALGVAISYAQMEAIEFLASVDDDRVCFETGSRKDPLGASVHNVNAIHMAAMNNNSALVEVLLHKHVPADLRDSDDATPLHYAAEANSASVVQTLLQSASEKGSDEVERMQRLKTSQWQLSALHVAVLHKNVQVIGHLLDWRADPAQRAQGLSPSQQLVSFNTLHLAVRGGRCDIIEMLLAARPQLVNSYELSVDSAADRSDQLDEEPDDEALPVDASQMRRTAYEQSMAQFYAESSAEVPTNTETPELADVPNSAGASSQQEERQTVGLTEPSQQKTQTELHATATPNSIHGKVQTALHMAVEQRDVSVIKLLLKSGADPSAWGIHGTPADLAQEDPTVIACFQS